MIEGFGEIMTFEETAKYLNSSLEGIICEQFAYLPYFGVYPNSSDMNELCEIASPIKQNDIKMNYTYNLKKGGTK
jgi:hypothetical protein